MSVFISYSDRDAEFVQRLSIELIRQNVKVWKDEWKLGPRDRFLDRLHDAIGWVPYFGLGVSQNAMESESVGRELSAAPDREDARVSPLRRPSVRSA